MFLLHEALITTHLSNVRDSTLEHWIAAISDNKEREVALTFYINNAYHPHHGKKDTNKSQMTSFPVKSTDEEDDVVFDERRDFEDIDEDFSKEPRVNKVTGLTELPPITVGLSRATR